MKVVDLNFGALDAVTYQQRQQKDFLNRVFLKDIHIDELLSDNKYFLIGEKGTGKTAYSTYIHNNSINGFRSSIKNMSDTDYTTFLNIEESGHFQVSDIQNCWNAILLLLASSSIKKNEKNTFQVFPKFHKLNEAIQSYHDGAFDPEIITALNFVKKSEDFIKLFAGNENLNTNFGMKDITEINEQGSKLKSNIININRLFKDAIEEIKLTSNHIIFIDGIDVRPEHIDYESYLRCVSGLAKSVWDLNTQFFANIKDSPGRIKIVALMRPDIFEAVKFHNSNAKIRDNGVYVRWNTKYGSYRSSRLFALVDKMLARQDGQPKCSSGEAWDHYFPYQIVNRKIAERLDDSFIGFLRNSLYRPRDIISFMKIMQEHINDSRPDAKNFTESDFDYCLQEYSDYLLGEIKDYLSFYHSPIAFDQLHGFFNHLSGKGRFTWDEFVIAHDKYKKEQGANITIAKISGKNQEFLQFLYEMNVIGYTETGKYKNEYFTHWHFRDSNKSKLQPQIPTGLQHSHAYQIHSGLLRSLKLGTQRFTYD